MCMIYFIIMNIICNCKKGCFSFGMVRNKNILIVV